MSAFRPGIALLPLRLFLGGTFAYAGIQKLSDPGFLHSGAPTYIGTQLHGFAAGTPGGFILRAFALPHPVLAGVGVAIVEILIGLLAVAGLLTRLAAIGGMGLSLLLFLTASWHASPYFLGPDIVFVFAWLPFVLAGAGEQPALDNALRHPSPVLVRRTTLGFSAEGASSAQQAGLTRRALLAEAGVAALGIAGVAALLKGSYSAPATVAGTKSSAGGGANAGSPAAGQAAPSAHASTAAPPSSPPAVPSGAVKLGRSTQLGSGQAAAYRDPSDGNPDLIIRQADGSLTAFSAICTHAGCQVGYSGGQIACPCHGATFDSSTGAVTGGPAPQGLPQKQVIEHGGEIYAVPS